MTFKKIAILHIILFLIVIIFSMTPWYFLMLTAAQLVFVPLTFQLIWKQEYKLYYYFAIPAFAAVFILQTTVPVGWNILFAIIYLLFTLVVALYGFGRFIRRGFANLEEFSIHMGLMYLFIGGAWFFAYIAEIDTGFSPLLTWLTAIHFHYSAFLLPIFVGFLGRLYKTTLYKVVCTIILICPIVVAIGITFFPWLEIVSVLLYIFGIYGLIYLTFKAYFASTIQAVLVRLSFGSLGVTIIFSLLYAARITNVDIDFMLRFHGFFNCVLFALCGVIGWSLFTPPSKERSSQFPLSTIRGKRIIGEEILTKNLGTDTFKGLVDDMSIYVDKEKLPSSIIHFYENTTQYRLFSEVRWHSWFKPLAFIYKLISRKVQQLNLPISAKQMEMTGDIVAIEDGREKTRAWIRKIEKDIIFVALYSSYQTKGNTYMNISLPLPWSSMIGILELHQQGEKLLLTSKGAANSDAGIYLTANKYVFKLPLQEQFLIREMKEDQLHAKHQMKIFSLPFLTIDYAIVLNENSL
ncbi:YndJ family protein [Psychrobacillus sp.]|uniref:YndJ family protein n=1 Tax=Psychrobacillus sp. TaxID=1871623 RepID=UPI0028BEDB67|nr:YndJ family protein [Psychrobacillus sp.]